MKLSVIIPVYNLEEWIEKSVNSILSQVCDYDFEIIIVDDGSSDNSGAIIDRLCNTDSRVRSIHQENAGVSAARNAGINVAEGEYVIFVDGDDILFPGALEILMNQVKNEGAILVCGLQERITSYEQAPSKKKFDTITSDSESILERLLVEDYNVSACAKIFNRALIGSIRFVEGKKINEDKFFLFEYLLRNKGFVFDIGTNIYGYYVRSGSATTSSFFSGTMDMIYFANAIEQKVKIFIPRLSNVARYNTLVAHLAVLKKLVRSNEHKAQRKLFQTIREDTLTLRKEFTGVAKNKHRLELLALRVNGGLYSACVKILDLLKKGC